MLTASEQIELADLQKLGDKATKAQLQRTMELMLKQSTAPVAEPAPAPVAPAITGLSVPVEVQTKIASLELTAREQQLVGSMFQVGNPIMQVHVAKENMTAIENPKYVKDVKRTVTQSRVSTAPTRLGNLNRNETPDETHARGTTVVDYIAVERPDLFLKSVKSTGKNGDGVQMNYSPRSTARASKESRTEFMSVESFTAWATAQLTSLGATVTPQAIESLRQGLGENLALTI